MLMNIISLLGGLALFLYGMQMMSDGLENAVGDQMKAILEKLTSHRIKAVLVGAIITAVIQSSSATTVMVVGFVNSGLMTLNQAIWIIMGANIGTTITGQLIALDIGAIAPLVAFVGVAVISFSKNERARHIAGIFAGLGILFIGMDMMSSSMAPLRESQTFVDLMTKFTNPLMGILAGAIFTAIIQSSSASVGILQALASTGAIPLSGAVYVLFGQNIGTCITALLAAIGTKVNAKRTTVIHLSFNAIGTAIFTLITLVTPFVAFMEQLTPGDPVAQIANIHTIFNIVTTLLLLPFGQYLGKLAVKILPESEEELEETQRLVFLDSFESKYNVGNIARTFASMDKEIGRMLDKVKENTVDAFDMVLSGSLDNYEKVEQREDYVDFLNTEITKHIVHCMSTDLTGKESERINGYYIIVSNLERIGDHVMNLAEYASTLKERNLVFSEEAKAEVLEMKDVCLDVLTHLELDAQNTTEILAHAARKEQKIDDMRKVYLENQMKRMQQGSCHTKTGLVYTELLTDFERIGDHALNIAEQYNTMYN